MGVAIDYSHENQVASITLMREKVRNALDRTTLEELARTFREADSAGVRVIILRGAGSSFSAGADRDEFPGYRIPELDEGATQQAINIGNQVTQAIMGASAITIAQVQGHAVGGGLVLAMCCDMRFAASNAQLSLPELTLGLPLGWGGLYKLVQLVGTTRAWELLSTARALRGVEAVDVGLFSGVAPVDGLSELVEQRVKQLLRISPAALLLTKRQFRAMAAAASLGALTEIDGALLLGSIRAPNRPSAFGFE